MAATATAAISMVPRPMPEELVVEEEVAFVAAALVVRDDSVEVELTDEVELINTGGPVDEEERQVELVLEEVVVPFDVEEVD
jgi:hypothetical protein